jgi:hypothetical protein
LDPEVWPHPIPINSEEKKRYFWDGKEEGQVYFVGIFTVAKMIERKKRYH